MTQRPFLTDTNCLDVLSGIARILVPLKVWARRLCFPALFSIFLMGCTRTPHDKQGDAPGKCTCIAMDTTTEPTYKTVRGALLGTRFQSLEALKLVIQIEYEAGAIHSDSGSGENYLVRLRHCSNGKEVVGILEKGTSQGDILKARHGTFKDRVGLLFQCPYAVRQRKDLGRANTLSRWRPQWFGEGDLAFFDLAKSMVNNINTPDLAFRNPRDSTEKGYLNSFNHITSQAFITSCFSEEFADFIGDAHERELHPELITGKFTEKQLQDLEEGPVDNYVDIINNKWGQELGKRLREKYRIDRETVWTPELLANYLNDLQAYYSWAFQIGFEPYRPESETVRKFSKKIDAVLRGHLRSYE